MFRNCSTSHKFDFFSRSFPSSPPPVCSSDIEKVVWGLLRPQKTDLMKVVLVELLFCISLGNGLRGKKYLDAYCNLTKILCEKWSVVSVLKSIFPGGTTRAKCEQEFCSMFGIDIYRVSVKDKETLVFVLGKGMHMLMKTAYWANFLPHRCLLRGGSLA